VRLSRGSNAASTASVSVSAESVAEHARQASLVLPGGLSVIGLFLFAPGGLAAAGAETSLLSAWREAVRISAASGGCRLGSSPGGGGGGGGVLLGADASSRGRVAAREVVAPGASPALRHADVRFAPLLQRLVSLRALYSVAARVDAFSKKEGEKGSRPLSALLSAVAGAEAARARRSVALGAGARPRPLDLDASIADSLGELGEPDTAGGAREVVLLPPAVSCSRVESDNDEYESDDGDDTDSAGTLRLEGWVEARATIFEHDSVREAVEALAADVGATVRARAAAAVEEAEAEAEEEEGGREGRPAPLLLSPPPTGSPVVVPLARRVLFPLLPGGGGGSSAPAALVFGGDLALPPPRRHGGGEGGERGGGGDGEGGEGERADGEGALDAAAQLCGRNDLAPEDLVFAEGRAEGTSAVGAAASLSSSSSARQRQQEQERQPGRGAAAATGAATAAARAPAAPSSARATSSISPVPLVSAGAVAAATLALALGVYLTLA
jgi:hypothetical protein